MSPRTPAPLPDDLARALASFREAMRQSDPKSRWEGVHALRGVDLSNRRFRREIARTLLLRVVDPDPYVRLAVSNAVLRLDTRDDEDLAKRVQHALAWQKAAEEAERKKGEWDLTDLDAAELDELHVVLPQNRRSPASPARPPSAGEEVAGTWSEYEHHEMASLPSRDIRILEAVEVTSGGNGRRYGAPPNDHLLSNASFLRLFSAAMEVQQPGFSEAQKHGGADGILASGSFGLSILLWLAEARNADLRAYASDALSHFVPAGWACERMILSLQRPDRRLRATIAHVLRGSLAKKKGSREICLAALARCEESDSATARARAVGLLIRARRQGAFGDLAAALPPPIPIEGMFVRREDLSPDRFVPEHMRPVIRIRLLAEKHRAKKRQEAARLAT